MRCVSCNCLLSDKESTRKSIKTKDYLDMCDGCLGTIFDDVVDSIDEGDAMWDTIDINDLEEGDDNLSEDE